MKYRFYYRGGSLVKPMKSREAARAWAARYWWCIIAWEAEIGPWRVPGTPHTNSV